MDFEDAAMEKRKRKKEVSKRLLEKDRKKGGEHIPINEEDTMLYNISSLSWLNRAE